MRISIITPSYNSEKYIADTIKSIAEQTYKNIEHIIVDGESQDATLKIVDSLKSEHTIVISEKDKGMYDAINKGLRVFTGDIVMCLNSDDRLYDKNVISDVVERISYSHSLTDFYLADVMFEYPDTTTSMRKAIRPGLMQTLAFGNCTFIPQPGLFIRRSLIKKVGFFDTEYRIASDYEFIIRLLQKGKGETLELCSTIFRRHSESLTEMAGIIMKKESKNISNKYIKEYKLNFLSRCYFLCLGSMRYIRKNPVVLKNYIGSVLR